MPNWCMNTMTVTAPQPKIMEWVGKLEETKGTNFFDLFVPNAEQAGEADEWYDYNLKTYGCKWNCDCDEWEVLSENEIRFTFSSPWGPPDALFDRIDAIEDQSVYAEFHETGMMFIGKYEDSETMSWEYTNATPDDVTQFVPEHLVESWGLVEMLEEYDSMND